MMAIEGCKPCAINCTDSKRLESEAPRLFSHLLCYPYQKRLFLAALDSARRSTLFKQIMWTSCFRASLSLARFLCRAVFKYFLLGSLVDVFEAVLHTLHQHMYLYWQLATNDWETGRFINYWYHAHKIEALNQTASRFSKASLSTERGKTMPFRDAIGDQVEFPHTAKFAVNITCPELPRVTLLLVSSTSNFLCPFSLRDRIRSIRIQLHNYRSRLKEQNCMTYSHVSRINISTVIDEL